MAGLEPALREDLIDILPAEDMSEVVSALETDDAVEVLEDLDKQQQDEILAGLTAADRWAVKDALRYPEDSRRAFDVARLGGFAQRLDGWSRGRFHAGRSGFARPLL